MLIMGPPTSGVVILFSLVPLTLGSNENEKSEKTAEQIEIELVAQQIQNEIRKMTNRFDRNTAENVHAMWHKKMLEIEECLRTDTEPVVEKDSLQVEQTGRRRTTRGPDDSQVELFAERILRRLDHWPEEEYPAGFAIHDLWYGKARYIEANLRQKYQ